MSLSVCLSYCWNASSAVYQACPHHSIQKFNNIRYSKWMLCRLCFIMFSQTSQWRQISIINLTHPNTSPLALIPASPCSAPPAAPTYMAVLLNWLQILYRRLQTSSLSAFPIFLMSLVLVQKHMPVWYCYFIAKPHSINVCIDGYIFIQPVQCSLCTVDNTRYYFNLTTAIIIRSIIHCLMYEVFSDI